MTDSKQLLRDSLSEEEMQPPPYTTQPKSSKHVTFVPERAGVRVQDAPLNNIYLGLFSMIFCVWPCGLVAVLLGIQAMQSHYRGDLFESRRKNTLSKRFSIASIVIGMLFILMGVMVVIAEYFYFVHLMKKMHEESTTIPTPIF